MPASPPRESMALASFLTKPGYSTERSDLFNSLLMSHTLTTNSSWRRAMGRSERRQLRCTGPTIFNRVKHNFPLVLQRFLCCHHFFLLTHCASHSEALEQKVRVPSKFRSSASLHPHVPPLCAVAEMDDALDLRASPTDDGHELTWVSGSVRTNNLQPSLLDPLRSTC